jgi:hypothetical protein
MYKIFRHNAGITLLELLIVLVISSIVVMELFSVYLQYKDHHLRNSALQEISREIGFVYPLLEEAVYGSGYLGYLSWKVLPVYDNIHKKMDERYLTLWDADDSQLPKNVQKKIKSDSQAIELKQMDFTLTSLSEKANQGDINIRVINNESLRWENGTYILIADSQHAEANQISVVRKMGDMKSVELAFPLSHSYDVGAYVGRYFDRFYYVGNTERAFSDNTPIYGLYVYNENGMTEEISDFISTLQIQGNISNGILKMETTMTTPYLVNGKKYTKKQEYWIALRE